MVLSNAGLIVPLGMCDILCKSSLTRALNNMRMLFPDEFDFYPRSWFLPEQRREFEDDAREIHKKDRQHRRPLTIFIVKPSGSGGAAPFNPSVMRFRSVQMDPRVLEST